MGQIMLVLQKDNPMPSTLRFIKARFKRISWLKLPVKGWLRKASCPNQHSRTRMKSASTVMELMVEENHLKSSNGTQLRLRVSLVLELRSKMEESGKEASHRPIMLTSTATTITRNCKENLSTFTTSSVTANHNN